jgi:starch-binding outer membrane protein, SusD/RagB family
MHKTIKLALGAALPALLLTGCSDWLSAPDVSTDPNRPTTATRSVLLTGVQAQTNLSLNGSLARLAGLFTQQLAGSGGQYVGYGQYNLTENDVYQEWAALYGGGGLLDIRRMRTMAEQAGDREFAGIAKVYEALIVGTTADIWGDIPYSEAVGGSLTPKLDNQLEVYDALQALLTSAIADLQSGEGTGPGAYDLAFGGDTEAWVEVAHTLKARLYLHTVEASADKAGVYTLALAEARQGISTPAHDLTSYSSSSAGSQNVWNQFMRDRSDYVRAGGTLVALLANRNDPRLAEYFEPLANGTFVGGLPGDGKGSSQLSSFAADRVAADFQQPIVTWAETKLIEAEALQQLGREPEARAALDAERTAAGLPGIASAVTGEALLREIIEEKYVALFQNIEVWNDWKRTCYPRLTGYDGQDIPARLFYPVNERNTNPNIPAPNTGVNGARNRNDPSACTA